MTQFTIAGSGSEIATRRSLLAEIKMHLKDNPILSKSTRVVVDEIIDGDYQRPTSQVVGHSNPETGSAKLE